MDKYLKMADYFDEGDVLVDGSSLHDASGVVAKVFGPSAYANYVAHAINSHDELVEEVERLRMYSELAIITLEEVDRVLTEKIKNGAYDLDDISGEVAYALERLSGHE